MAPQVPPLPSSELRMHRTQVVLDHLGRDGASQLEGVPSLQAADRSSASATTFTVCVIFDLHRGVSEA